VNPSLDPLLDWPCQPPDGYRGQLDPAFQKERAAAHAQVAFDECSWYHSTDIPGKGSIKGSWDLRGREQSYLGEWLEK